MELEIKQLKQGSQIFVPQTTAEAVLVNNGEDVIRLDEALSLKSGVIITPLTSGLNSYPSGNSVIITHSNNITQIESPQPLLISYDQHGHITNATPTQKLKLNVNNVSHIEFDGSEEKTIQLGDDFRLDDYNNIKLNWIEHGDT